MFSIFLIFRSQNFELSSKILLLIIWRINTFERRCPVCYFSVWMITCLCSKNYIHGVLVCSLLRLIIGNAWILFVSQVIKGLDSVRMPFSPSLQSWPMSESGFLPSIPLNAALQFDFELLSWLVSKIYAKMVVLWRKYLRKERNGWTQKTLMKSLVHTALLLHYFALLLWKMCNLVWPVVYDHWLPPLQWNMRLELRMVLWYLNLRELNSLSNMVWLCNMLLYDTLNFEIWI